MSSYDFDVENYTCTELFNFFKIQNDNISELEVSRKIDNTIKKYEQAEQTKNNIEFKEFLHKSKNKLINYIKNTYQKPTNYNIIHSASNTEGGSHDITVDKIIPVVNTYEYKYPVGVINPIEKRVITKIINLDSLFRSNYDSTIATDYTWELPTKLSNVVSMNIVALELPNMWYTISSKNGSNWFKINLYNINDTSGNYYNITHTIQLPDGNYMPSSFSTIVNNYFMNVKQGLDLLIFSIDNITTKSTIRARNELVDNPPYPAPYNNYDPIYSPDFYFEIEFIDSNTIPKDDSVNFELEVPQYGILNEKMCKSFLTTPIFKSLGWFLGFRNSKYISVKNNTRLDVTNYTRGPITFYCSLISEGSYGDTLDNYIFIEVNDFNKNFITDSITSLTNEAYIGNNILGRITISTLPNTIIFNNSSDRIFKTREYLGPVKINKLTVRILNKFGIPVDLNNNDFSLALEFKILY